jgi:putative oxidoreductase
VEALKRCYRGWIDGLRYAQPAFLLAVRVLLGWGFIAAGWGKLTNVADAAAFFKSSGVTFMPELNVYLAGTTETVCGFLLILGAASRVITIPLIGTMIVALATAHKEIFDDLLADPNGFVKAFNAAPPLPYLLTAFVVLLFGPGLFSVDGLLRRLVIDRPCRHGPKSFGVST